MEGQWTFISPAAWMFTTDKGRFWELSVKDALSMFIVLCFAELTQLTADAKYSRAALTSNCWAVRIAVCQSLHGKDHIATGQRCSCAERPGLILASLLGTKGIATSSAWHYYCIVTRMISGDCIPIYPNDLQHVARCNPAFGLPQRCPSFHLKTGRPLNVPRP